MTPLAAGPAILLASGNADTVLSGALLLAVPVAMLGGLVSFFSPCVLPLVPGYLSYVTGYSAADLADAEGASSGPACSSSSASSSSPASGTR